jgi:hypothetical protein
MPMAKAISTKRIVSEGIRHRPPERETARHIEKRPEQDPGALAAGAVGDGAQNRRRQRDQDARDRHHPAEHGLPGDRIGRDGGGEIGREDEGQKQRVVGLVGPVEPPPAPDLSALARFGQRAFPIPARTFRQFDDIVETPSGDRRERRQERVRAAGRSTTKRAPFSFPARRKPCRRDARRSGAPAPGRDPSRRHSRSGRRDDRRLRRRGSARPPARPARDR